MKEKVSFFTCDICKKDIKVKHYSFTSGYATNKYGEKICYECCANFDKEHMEKHKKITLYLVKRDDKYFVTNWPSSLEFNVHSWKKGAHNWGLKRIDVWFKDENNNWWWGKQIGYNNELCHCRMIKG